MCNYIYLIYSIYIKTLKRIYDTYKINFPIPYRVLYKFNHTNY